MRERERELFVLLTCLFNVAQPYEFERPLVLRAGNHSPFVVEPFLASEFAQLGIRKCHEDVIE